MDVQVAPAGLTVLLLRGTGRTGGRVLEQLLSRGVSVRAVVRSAERVLAGAVGDPRLTLVVADLLSLTDEELVRQVEGCDVVISCLGHVTSLRGSSDRRETSSLWPRRGYAGPSTARDPFDRCDSS